MSKLSRTLIAVAATVALAASALIVAALPASAATTYNVNTCELNPVNTQIDSAPAGMHPYSRGFPSGIFGMTTQGDLVRVNLFDTGHVIGQCLAALGAIPGSAWISGSDTSSGIYTQRFNFDGSELVSTGDGFSVVFGPLDSRHLDNGARGVDLLVSTYGGDILRLTQSFQTVPGVNPPTEAAPIAADHTVAAREGDSVELDPYFFRTNASWTGGSLGALTVAVLDYPADSVLQDDGTVSFVAAEPTQVIYQLRTPAGTLSNPATVAVEVTPAEDPPPFEEPEPPADPGTPARDPEPPSVNPPSVNPPSVNPPPSFRADTGVELVSTSQSPATPIILLALAMLLAASAAVLRRRVAKSPE